MNQPPAFRATYSDMKLVKTRGVAQLIFEIPLADFDAAYEVLGGLPDGSKERWFGIAALRSEPSGAISPPRQWKDLQPAQQAGIRSDDPIFIAFLKAKHSDDWHETGDGASCIRLICNVKSRVEFGTNHEKRVLWHQLDSEFQAWKAIESA